MENVVFYVMAFIGGILSWTLRSLFLEKTMKRRAGDQYVSLGELDLYCRRKHDTDKIIKEMEIKHLKELIEKDLTSNTSRLEKLESTVSGLSDTLNDIGKKITRLLDK